ncbi:ATP-binding protein [uncultured Brevundimonas sp.]|uniref:sensor histidine kinase n=1 Tax=uncultured Brevundimonas sp. TaxID=213418 RepID=UPI0030EE709C
MRGNERRIIEQGRRTSDGRTSAPTWARVLILSIALAIAAYVLLFAREIARPGLEVDALRTQAVASEARLLALDLENRLAPVRRGAEAGADTLAARPYRPLDAIDAARAVSPGSAFAVITADGRVLAAVGDKPDSFTGSSDAGIHLSADGQALLLQPAGLDEVVLVGRVPLPELTTGVGVDLSLLTDPTTVLASGRTADGGADGNPALGLDSAPIEADGRVVTVHLDKEGLIRAAVPVGESGLIAVASAPFSIGANALLNDVWVLAAPLGIGVVVLGLVLMMHRRQARASREWAASERRFRIAVEGARCGVWEWDLEEGEVNLSDYMAVLLGFEQGGPVTAEAVSARIHPRYRAAVDHALRQAATFGAFEVTFPVPDENGRARWIDARGQSRGPRGDAGFTSILGVALDITEARRAKAHAQAAESRLRDGIESVSDAFVLFDKHNRLILWNQAFQDAFSFEAGIVRRGALKDDLNRIAALAIKGDRPAAGGRAGAREVELHDGRWLQLSERFTSDGGSVVTAADITAIKQQEAERERAAQALQTTVNQLEISREELSQLARKYEVAMTRAEAANQAKSEFLANMSHELRTPLNAINGFSEIMEAEMFGPLGDARYKGYAADILQSGQHLLSLINDILDMAKIEAGKLTLHYEKVSLQELCEDAIRLMRGKIQESGLTLSLDAPDLPEIDADHRGLKQIMLNLISNAVKFTPEGGDIIVALRSEEGRVRVAVTDTGIGIAPEDVARLARPFEQVEGQHSKTTQGTGLGLSLTRSLIELHHGEMVIDSEPGRGTTVSFALPIERPVMAEPQQARAA